jgi:hypothetical protein
VNERQILVSREGFGSDDELSGYSVTVLEGDRARTRNLTRGEVASAIEAAARKALPAEEAT